MAVFITLGDSDELQIRIPIDGQTGWGPQLIEEFFKKLVEHDHSGVAGKGVPISGSGLAADSVAGAQLRLLNDQYLRSRNAADSGDVNIVKVNALDEIEFGAIIGNLIATASTITTLTSTTINAAEGNIDLVDYKISTATNTPITAPNDAVTNSTVIMCSTTEIAIVKYRIVRGTTIQAGTLMCNGSTQDLSDEFVGPDAGVTFSLSATNELITTVTDNVDDATITYTIDRR